MFSNRAKLISKKRASYRLGWWRSHHEKDQEKLLESLANEISEDEKLPLKAGKVLAVETVNAAKLHDLAEQEGISIEESEDYWEQCELALQNYYKKVGKFKRQWLVDRICHVTASGLNTINLGLGMALMMYTPNIVIRLALLPAYIFVFGSANGLTSHSLDHWFENPDECTYSNPNIPMVSEASS